MKKILVGLAVAVALAVVSCATAPKPEEPVEKPVGKPVEKPVEKPEPPAKAGVPEAEYAQAKELKSLVDRYGLGQYAPEEYRQAEAKLAEAEKAYRKNNAAAKKALDEAIRGYNAVLGKGFPLLADARQKEVEAAKAQADSIKSQRAAPEPYAKAQAKYDEAVAARKAGDFEKSMAAFDEAQRLFQDLYVQVKAMQDRAAQSLRSAQEGLKDAEQRAKNGDVELQGAQ